MSWASHKAPMKNHPPKHEYGTSVSTLPKCSDQSILLSPLTARLDHQPNTPLRNPWITSLSYILLGGIPKTQTPSESLGFPTKHSALKVMSSQSSLVHYLCSPAHSNIPIVYPPPPSSKPLTFPPSTLQYRLGQDPTSNGRCEVSGSTLHITSLVKPHPST